MLPLSCHNPDGAEKVWDNNEQQDYHLQVAPTQQQTHGTAQPAAGRGAATASRGGGTIAAVALTPTAGVNGAHPSSSSSNGGNILSAAVAAAATTPVQTFSSRAATAEGVAGGVLRMLESLRTCAIGDGCGFVSRDSLDRAEQNILHGANAPAHQAAATAEANGQMVFLMPQQPVAGLPVSLYVNKARLQDVLKRSPNMCLQVGFNNWSVGLQKVRGVGGSGGGVCQGRRGGAVPLPAEVRLAMELCLLVTAYHVQCHSGVECSGAAHRTQSAQMNAAEAGVAD